MDKSVHYTFLSIIIVLSFIVLISPFWATMSLKKGNLFEDDLSWGLFYVSSDLSFTNNDFSLLDEYAGFTNFKYYRNVVQGVIISAVVCLCLALTCSLMCEKVNNLWCFSLLLLSGILFFIGSIIAMSTDFAQNQDISRVRMRSFEVDVRTGSSAYTAFTIGMTILLYCILLLSMPNVEEVSSSKFNFYEHQPKQYFNM